MQPSSPAAIDMYTPNHDPSGRPAVNTANGALNAPE